MNMVKAVPTKKPWADWVPVPDMSVVIHAKTGSLRINYSVKPGRWYHKALFYLGLMKPPSVRILINGSFAKETRDYMKSSTLVGCDPGAYHVAIYRDNNDRRWEKYKSRSLVVEEVWTNQ